MEKIPHKSTWKGKRKKEEEIPVKENLSPKEFELQEKIDKIKKYTKICAVILVATLVAFFIYPFAILFINVIAVYLIVFLIYFFVF